MSKRMRAVSRRPKKEMAISRVTQEAGEDEGSESGCRAWRDGWTTQNMKRAASTSIWSSHSLIGARHRDLKKRTSIHHL